MPISLTCPYCPESSLLHEAASARCPECGRQYPAGADWIDVSNQSGFYWGELERAVMQRLVDSPGSIRENLVETIRQSEKSLGDYLRHYAFDPNRAAWKFLLPLPADATILDMGCGLGALALSLAEHASSLIVADIVPERVRLTVRRLREDAGCSVQGLVASGVPHLPLPAQSVDLVVVNGVLEWIPAGVEGHPEQLQQGFLREIARVLKPTGVLYLGIENRFGASYFRGKPEEHTKLKFISLLPRPLGRLYHRLANKAPYRAYTYGRRALERRLARAGFGDLHLYSPYPDYREFVSMVRVDDPAWMANAFRPRSRKGRLAKRVVTRTRLFGHLTNSFGMLAHRGRAEPSYLDRLLGRLREEGRLAPASGVLGYEVRTSGVISVFAGETERTHIISIPLDAQAGRRLQRDAEMRLTLQRLPGLDIPEGTMIQAGRINFEGRDLLFAPCVRGHRLSELHGEARVRGNAAAWDWLIAFHRNTRNDLPLDLGWLEPGEWGGTIRALDGPTGGELGRLLRMCEGRAVRVGPVHGDFHAGNVFVTGAWEIERVVDWDLAALTGLPLWDPFTFILRDLLEDGHSWGEAYRKLCEASLPPHRLATESGRFSAALGLRTQDVIAALLTLPIVHLHAQRSLAGKEGQEIVDGTVRTLDRAGINRLEAALAAGDALAGSAGH